MDSSTQEELPEIEVTPNMLYKAGALTAGFCFIPVSIMTNKRVFAKFNAFHSRLFRLEKRSAGGLAGFAFLASLGYSAILIPLYYRGIMHIFGLEGFGVVRDVMKAKMEMILAEDENLDFRGRIQEAVAHDEKVVKSENNE